MKQFIKAHRSQLKWISILLLILFLIWYAFCLPKQLFNDSTATVVLDRNGKLLGAKIAEDGQWRFAESDSVPYKFKTCIIQFEDRNFYKHPGVSIQGIGRSVVQNFKNRKIVSGGSTLTMQVVRIMKKNPRRTFLEKIIEMIIATRLEWRYSKKEILCFYTGHAPFGNNVVGLEAASWRYFGRSASSLSWAESATLAVLPNTPGLIYPGKNHERLLAKRNRLLRRLLSIGVLDETAFQLALSEQLPDKPLPLPQLAPHLLVRLIKEGKKGQTITTSIDYVLQEKVAAILKQHSLQLRDNKIFNGAVVVTSIKTGQVLAYVGNTFSEGVENSSNVDCLVAPRSSGSILKPLLYEAAMEDGIINPKTLLLDVPSHFGNFSPKNFSREYDGALPANQALSRSLNIPFVRLLNEYGLEKFHHHLKCCGISTLNQSARHYGLSLILGGAEVKLWDLNKIYTNMAQQLSMNECKSISLLIKRNNSISTIKPMSKACVYATFEAMTEVNRPDEDGNWQVFAGAQKVAWKTGTSFGFRDAWAIGITPDYVVAVWVGNADGEGRPGLTGIRAAAPLMFNVFQQLPKSVSWFSKPLQDMTEIKICRESGYRAGELCEHADNVTVPTTCLNTTVCPYHQLVHLNKHSLKRVDADCENPFEILHTTWYVLPPAIEKYYKYNHPDYKVLPDYKPECLAKISDKSMAILSPRPRAKIYVPIEIDGTVGQTIFEAVHRNSGVKIYWHLDEVYLGETREIHQMALNPVIGEHVLLLTDENGFSQQVKFEVVGK